MIPVVAGQTIVVAVFATADFQTNAGMKTFESVVPIAAALANVQTGLPGRLVEVTKTGVATPVRAAEE